VQHTGNEQEIKTKSGKRSVELRWRRD